MGILNVTPDSFSDGGTHNSLIDAVKHANLMINAGATIIDVGGESTRPERRKLALKKSCNVLFLWLRQLLNASKSGSRSIHPNQKSSVSQRKLALTLLTISAPFPNQALEAAAETGLPVCLMHMQGNPKTMQEAPKYDDVFAEVNRYFIEQIARCEQAGIAKRNCCSTPDSVSVKISPITIHYWRAWLNFTISTCRCWWVCHENR